MKPSNYKTLSEQYFFHLATLEMERLIAAAVAQVVLDYEVREFGRLLQGFGCPPAPYTFPALPDRNPVYWDELPGPREEDIPDE